jgi:hypothetical protein
MWCMAVLVHGTSSMVAWCRMVPLLVPCYKLVVSTKGTMRSAMIAVLAVSSGKR